MYCGSFIAKWCNSSTTRHYKGTVFDKGHCMTQEARTAKIVGMRERKFITQQGTTKALYSFNYTKVSNFRQVQTIIVKSASWSLHSKPAQRQHNGAQRRHCVRQGSLHDTKGTNGQNSRSEREKNSQSQQCNTARRGTVAGTGRGWWGLWNSREAAMLRYNLSKYLYTRTPRNRRITFLISPIALCKQTEINAQSYFCLGGGR